MTLIEKMARAMHVETYATDDFDEQREEFRQEWLTLAKAALSAIEPTEAMIEAGARAANDPELHTYPEMAKSSFWAMINAAKEAE